MKDCTKPIFLLENEEAKPWTQNTFTQKKSKRDNGLTVFFAFSALWYSFIFSMSRNDLIDRSIRR